MSDREERPRTYLIRTFGCQMNVHDSEHVAGVLELLGYQAVDDVADAELVVINTCSVRGSAEARVWGLLDSLSASGGQGVRIAVCGCMAELYGVEILRRYPSVDLVFGVESLPELERLLEKGATSPVCSTGRLTTSHYEELESRRGLAALAWVPVSHGCDNSCSYCIVPRVRGRLRSRPPGDVLSEVGGLVGAGAIEVVLLGQNVNAYGTDLEGPFTFPRLLEELALTGVPRVRFETSHPADISDELIRVMAGERSVCEHLHLPVQSGSDQVLEAMDRGYDSSYFLERVSAARRAVGGLSVTTDIIVGFPAEEERDFEDTLSLMREAELDAAFIFMYSPRTGTPAAAMEDRIPAGVKRNRLQRAGRLQEEMTRKALRRLVGSSQELLVTGEAKRGGYRISRTRDNKVVLLPTGQAPLGALVKALVTGAGGHSLRGSVEEVILAPGERRD